MIENIPNPKGHQNHVSGSKVTAILMKGWILSVGGVASGRVGACSLHTKIQAAILFLLLEVGIYS